jgi:hypothetical protein
MELIVVLGLLLALGIAALEWGADSRRIDPRQNRREGLF